MIKPKKVLILGSGALKIGEAGEFDYSGSQAIKAMKEEGIKTILINPNIATIQTSEHLADQVYFLPVQPFFVEKVIKKESPDGILLAFGGQTALNCGIELYKQGVFKKYKIQVLGTPVQTIIDSEDRELFVKRLDEIKLKTPKSKAVTSIKAACAAANHIGYPVMMRTAFSLGGQGSGVAYHKSTLVDMATKAFTFTPQILIEEYLAGWKEVEYEVVRDYTDNCITVCNMENMDPLGIHTGESIVVSPSQTLTNHEYHYLREISIACIRHLGVIGECNIQFALNPKNNDYRIIEVNARLSRSSALASKATGYPLAFVAAKLGLGYTLDELKNAVTLTTKACFEPALDYCVVKIPRWDLEKFRAVSHEIGSGMKSVGEVMGIGRNFEEALQKAIRMLDIGMHGITGNKEIVFHDLKKELSQPTDKRLFAIPHAYKKGMSVQEIARLTKIDEWFLHKILNILDTESYLISLKKNHIKDDEINHSNKLFEGIILAKKLGFSDKQVAFCLGCDDDKVREYRHKHKIIPVINQIDTLAAEYPAKTNYLYLTYNGDYDDIIPSRDKASKETIMVLGSGTYRIGSSVEFDWCCVNAIMTLRNLKYTTVMINYNPETVSTDYDICDRLYFDEISFETVYEIYQKENPEGMIISMGGQIPNNLAMKCHQKKLKVLGTSPIMIDSAEDRHKFSKLLDTLGIDQPDWSELTSIREAKEFGARVGYPVLVRPSYVLSGAAMAVAVDEKMLEIMLKKAADVSPEHPVVISKFIEHAKELEIDAVALKGKILEYAISEHVENAGVHSGDATVVYPAKHLYIETVRKVMKIAESIAAALEITGPFNIQFIAKHNFVKVIECNLRASRSFPFVSKVKGRNFIDLATKAIVNYSSIQNIIRIDESTLEYVGVKSPQFSFSRLKGADPVLSVEMSSTGEVACLGGGVYDAFLKSILSAGTIYPHKSVLLSISEDRNRYLLIESIVKLMEHGYKIYATANTSAFLRENDLPNTLLYKIHEKKEPNIRDYLLEKKIDMVINIPRKLPEAIETDDHYQLRRLATDLSIPLITNLQIAKLFIHSICVHTLDSLEIKSWQEYTKSTIPNNKTVLRGVQTPKKKDKLKKILNEKREG